MTVREPKMLPRKTAIVSIIVGDDTAVGYGSRAAQVRRWSSSSTSLPYAKIWDKWTGGRDTAADTGAAMIPITRGMGLTASDVGIEYSIGARMEELHGGTLVDRGTPDCCIIKYATPGASASPSAATTKSWHPVAGSGSAFDIFRDGYLAPALVWLRANYDAVLLDTVYVSLGLADALDAGTGDAFAANLDTMLQELRLAVGVTTREVVIVPPLADRNAYPALDVVRYAGELVPGPQFIDADPAERGGVGVGVTPLNSVLSGQGIIDLGSEVTLSRIVRQLRVLK